MSWTNEDVFNEKERIRQKIHYRLHPEEWARDNCGFEATDQQKKAFEALATPRSKTSIASGHGTGKTGFLAIGILWALDVFDIFGKEGEITDPTTLVVFSTVGYLYNTGRHHWISSNSSYDFLLTLS